MVFLSPAVVNPNCKTEAGLVQGRAGPVNKIACGRKGSRIFEPERWWSHMVQDIGVFACDVQTLAVHSLTLLRQ